MKVAILGNGGFGTAMAMALSRGGREVSLWGHDAAYTAEIARTRRNPRYLDSAELPASVQIGSELGPAVAGAGAVLVAVPAQHVRAVVGGHRGELANVPLVSLAKGLEQGTSLRPSQVIAECVGHGERVLALSGPSHAEEIAQGLPTTVVLAGKDDHLLRALQEILNVPGLRTYRNHDLLGVELCGALKNVIALAAGIADGLGYGDNAKAAILARGIVEMVRFGKQSGADERTFYGLAGVGDLAVTAFSRHGRNRAFGERLGRGETMAAILASTQKVAEGVFTAKVAVTMARQLHVDMPLCFAVDQVLHHGLAPATAVRKLMERDPKAEG